MEIVVTDGFTLNPGDLYWKSVEALGNLKYYDRTAAAETIGRCYNANVIISNKTIISKDVMDACTNLQLVAVSATGYNNVDIAAAKSKGITVCNVPGYGPFSVAQHAFALLLELTNHVGINAASVHNGGWQQSIDYCYTLKPIMELKDKVMGIIGLGTIGSKMAVMAQAFGMKVIYNGGRQKVDGAIEVSQHQLFMESDVISLHCPLTKDNKGFVNKELLELVKPTALLVNTARGALINEKHLAQMLQQKQLAGAALDVLTQEPPEKDNPLTGLENCMITAHNAWLSGEARRRIMQMTAANIAAFLKGEPVHVVG